MRDWKETAGFFVIVILLMMFLYFFYHMGRKAGYLEACQDFYNGQVKAELVHEETNVWKMNKD